MKQTEEVVADLRHASLVEAGVIRGTDISVPPGGSQRPPACDFASRDNLACVMSW